MLYHQLPNFILSQMGSLDTFRIGLIVLMILSGAMNTLNDKFQNKQRVTEGGTDKYFYHPYMQTTAVFIGESMAFILYLVLKKKDPQSFAKRQRQAQQSGKVLKFNKMLLAVSALCDVFASTMQCIALNFISGSAYQMMRGGTVATTFLFTIIYLKHSAKRSQIFGSLMTIMGVLIVGSANLIYSASGSGSSNPGLEIVGYLLLIFSLFLNGFQFAYEEGIFQKYHIEPVLMVGIQGLIGLTTNLIMISIFTFIPCEFGVEACVYTDWGAYLERPDVYFQELGSNHILLGFCIFYVFTVMVFNITGLSITRYINALARAVCDVSRTVIIWIVGIVVTVTAGETKENYKWENIAGGAIAIQLFGFLLIIFGNLVYNRIIILPCVIDKKQQTALLTVQNTEQ